MNLLPWIRPKSSVLRSRTFITITSVVFYTAQHARVRAPQLKNFSLDTAEGKREYCPDNGYHGDSQ